MDNPTESASSQESDIILASLCEVAPNVPPLKLPQARLFFARKRSRNAPQEEEREEHRQRETPTSQEMREILGDEPKLISRRRQQKMRAYALAVNEALAAGILTQISPPSGLYSDSSLSATPNTQSTADTALSFSDLKEEEQSLLQKLQIPGHSVRERLAIVEALQANLTKQLAPQAADEAHNTPSLSF